MLSRERASGGEGEQDPLHLGHGHWLNCSNSPLKSQVLTACALRCRKGPDLATAHGDPRGSPHRLEVTCW